MRMGSELLPMLEGGERKFLFLKDSRSTLPEVLSSESGSSSLVSSRRMCRVGALLGPDLAYD